MADRVGVADPEGMLIVIAYEEGSRTPHFAVNQLGVGKDCHLCSNQARPALPEYQRDG